MPQLARCRVESSARLGQHRWVLERTMATLKDCHRLHHRYERKAEHFLALVGLASVLICYHRCAQHGHP
ncbi:transposase [Streptomyces pseudovenezuelae]|uniref:transposase n=1 Tax=Streptomyces pseudovenezuelae TaxID=67350 RepID=UPI0038B67022